MGQLMYVKSSLIYSSLLKHSHFEPITAFVNKKKIYWLSKIFDMLTELFLLEIL